MSEKDGHITVTKTMDSKGHLCNTCIYSYPECFPTIIKFGNGTGNDNCIVCSQYKSKEESNENGDCG